MIISCKPKLKKKTATNYTIAIVFSFKDFTLQTIYKILKEEIKKYQVVLKKVQSIIVNFIAFKY